MLPPSHMRGSHVCLRRPDRRAAPERAPRAETNETDTGSMESKHQTSGSDTIMTLVNGIQGLIGGDRPTTLIPPSSGGSFQGWGTRIG